MPENTSKLTNFINTSFAAEWGGLLYEISRQFTATLELDDLLSRVLNLTREAVDAQRGSIFLLDAAGSVTRSLTSREDRPIEVIRHAVSEAMNDGLAGWVYTYQKSDVIFDTFNDDRWVLLPGDSDISRSAMAAPLTRRGQVVGIVTLSHPDPNQFTPRHLILLDVIAAQAAAAIENAAMYTDANLERLKLQAIIEGVQDVIFVADVHDCLSLANTAAQLELGISAQAYGRKIDLVLPEGALLDFYHQGQVSEQGQQEIKIGAQQTYNASIVHIPNLGKVVTLHDVTTFKRLDELKSHFVSQVSHDLKAPLGIVQGYAWLLTHTSDLDEESLGYVQHIQNSVERMVELINHLLDLGKIEMGIESEFQATNLVELARNTITHLDPLAKKGNIRLTFETPAENALVWGSGLRLEQAVGNLLGNAIKFTPPGGEVIVLVEINGEQVNLRVIDQGPGIPATMQSRLFQKFSRLGQDATIQQEGHGLGLAIVKSILDAHQGQLWVESQPGQGSTFAFSLPRYKPDLS